MDSGVEERLALRARARPRGGLAGHHGAEPRHRPATQPRLAAEGRDGGRRGHSAASRRRRLRGRAPATDSRSGRERSPRALAADAPGAGAGIFRGPVAERDRGPAERAARHREIMDETGLVTAPPAGVAGGEGMTPHRAEHLDLCAGYVLGSLDGAERVELESHLAEGCPECEAELARLSAGLFALAASAPARPAPPSLRARILAAVREGAGGGDAAE